MLQTSSSIMSCDATLLVQQIYTSERRACVPSKAWILSILIVSIGLEGTFHFITRMCTFLLPPLSAFAHRPGAALCLPCGRRFSPSRHNSLGAEARLPLYLEGSVPLFEPQLVPAHMIVQCKHQYEKGKTSGGSTSTSSNDSLTPFPSAAFSSLPWQEKE